MIKDNFLFTDYQFELLKKREEMRGNGNHEESAVLLAEFLSSVLGHSSKNEVKEFFKL